MWEKFPLHRAGEQVKGAILFRKREWPLSLSKKSGWSWAFSDRYGRVGKGDARCWNAGKWIEIW